MFAFFFYLFNNFGLQSKICAFKEASQPYEILKQKVASSGNRTRAARVAGEHSTTEPTMLTLSCEISINEINSYNQKRSRKYETHKWKSVDQNKISVTKAWCCQKFFTQSVGFEPTLPEGIWFLVRRLNHSATTALLSICSYLAGFWNNRWMGFAKFPTSPILPDSPASSVGRAWDS